MSVQYQGGFTGQNTGVTGTTPIPLVATVGTQTCITGVRLKALQGNGTDIVYFGFYATQALATAGMTTSNSYPLEAGVAESIDVGAINFGNAQYGDLGYIFLLPSAGTLSVAYWGK